ncbi:MAG TPA: class I SAM-dependent methyltransferase [Solirubrobacteraceae bacterium]
MSDMWDGVAGAWERNADAVDAQLAPATSVMLDAAGIGVGSAVLDIACGAGSAGIVAAGRAGAEGRVALADDAPLMVEAAARRSAGLPQVTTLVCDLEQIDAPDASFDGVICRHGLMFADDKAAAVAEARRVLRPGGRYAAMTWDGRAANPWLGLIMDAVGEQFGVPFPPPGIPGPFALDDPELLAQALRAGGLQDVVVTRVATPMRTTSIDTWWDLVPQLAGPLAIALEGMDPGVRDAIRDRALAKGAAAARPTAEGIEMDGSVLVAAGHRARD